MIEKEEGGKHVCIISVIRATEEMGFAGHDGKLNLPVLDYFLLFFFTTNITLKRK